MLEVISIVQLHILVCLPHSLRHPRPAMSWCLADARKAAENAASARTLHCNALVCVSVKANASRLGQKTC